MFRHLRNQQLLHAIRPKSDNIVEKIVTANRWVVKNNIHTGLTVSIYVSPPSSPLRVPNRVIQLRVAEPASQVAQELARRIVRDLRDASINVMLANSTDCGQSDGEQNNCHQRHDYKGVQYTIVIDRRTLEFGILGLQHYDPYIREQVHVSDIKAKLLLNLRIVKPTMMNVPSLRDSFRGAFVNLNNNDSSNNNNKVCHD